MATTYEDVLNLFREVAESQKETERKFQETERLLKEQSQETDRKIKKMANTVDKLGNRLGDYIEDAVHPVAVIGVCRVTVRRGLIDGL